MIRVALAVGVSLLALAAAPSSGAAFEKRYCYEDCYNICIAKGGTSAACDFECAAAPPCDSKKCDKAASAVA